MGHRLSRFTQIFICVGLKICVYPVRHEACNYQLVKVQPDQFAIQSEEARTA